MEFARFLGPVYIAILLAGFVVSGLITGPLIETRPALGIGLLMAGIVASIFLAGQTKLMVDRLRTRQ